MEREARDVQAKQYAGNRKEHICSRNVVGRWANSFGNMFIVTYMFLKEYLIENSCVQWPFRFQKQMV